MIEQIRLRNFKCFGEAAIPIRPLTAITGLNGSGKSTILQSLLIAREAGRSAGRVVPLNGPYGMALGEANDVLHMDASAPIIEIDITDGGAVYSYRFDIPDERRLHLTVAACPETPPPTLDRSGSDFTYLMAERLGPRDQLVVTSEDVRQVG